MPPGEPNAGAAEPNAAAEDALPKAGVLLAPNAGADVAPNVLGVPKPPALCPNPKEEPVPKADGCR